MAPPANLREIGLEGFGLIDKYYGGPGSGSGAGGSRRPNSNGVLPARQGRWVVQVPNNEMEEPPMNSKEVAARFGGVMIVNYFRGGKQQQQHRCGRPFRT